MPTDVSDAEILDAHGRTLLDGLHTAMPAKVVTYHADTQTADVQPMCKRVLFFEDGTRTYEELPQIQHVPVAFPRGGGYVLAFPLSAGDPVWLIFSEVATGEWQTTGDVAEPLDTRRHGLGYPVAYPGAYPDTKPLKDASTAGSSLLLGKDNDSAQVVVGSGSLTVGKSGATVAISGGDGGALVKETPYTAMLSALASFATATASALTAPQIALAAAALQTALGLLPPPGTTKTTAT